MKKYWRRGLLLAAGCFLLFGIFFVVVPPLVAAGFPLEHDAFVQVQKKLNPSVVIIETRGEKGLGSGTGFIVDKDGTIVTNHHVVGGTDEVYVLTSDGKRHAAKVLGFDAAVDIAILHVGFTPETTVIPASFGDSDALEVGEWVVAIGNTLGFGIHVTAGIVSAKGTDVLVRKLGDKEVLPPISFIHHSASINQGNSGGPLVNLDGEVVGINTLILSSRGMGGPTAAILNIAVPGNYARDLLPFLKRGEAPRQGWIGLSVATPFPEDYDLWRIPKGTQGIIVTQVAPGGPAAKAGIQLNDFIVSVGGRTAENPKQFAWLVQNARGRTLFTLYRQGMKKDITVSVGTKP